MKRGFDFIVSLAALTFLLPFFFVIALWIKADSSGPVFYRQVRVGRRNIDFRIFKFRTMFTGADRNGLITIGGRDPRVTRSGYMLRRYKLDELPQFLNVLSGEMSIVGPRPEVRKYVAMYNTEQLQVLEVKPGITDYASLEYAYENELLAKANDPEKEYIEVILPAKLNLNLKYIREQSMITDLRIIAATVKKVLF